MKRLLLAASLLLPALPAVAQDTGYWHAISTTARSITGDIGISEDKLTINFFSFTIADIRALKPEEILAAFNTETPTAGAGNLYRLNISAKKTLLHKNTLCGAEDTQWMATFRSGKTLQLAFFSGSKMPELKAESLLNTTTLCGTFTYSR